MARMNAPVILLKEGTDTSQGIPQIISNINACQAIADAVRTTLGPRGLDKLIVDDRDDDVFVLLKESFGAKGPGARKKVSGVVLTNKLLLQMYVLKHEHADPPHNKTWDDAELFLKKILKLEVPQYKLRTMMESVVKAILSLTDNGLSSFLDLKVDAEPGLGPFSDDIGLTSDNLMSMTFTCICKEPSNGLVLELDKFKTRKSLPFENLQQQLIRLINFPSGDNIINTAKLRRSIEKMKEQHKRLRKDSGSEKGSQKLKAFLTSKFSFPLETCVLEPENVSHPPSFHPLARQLGQASIKLSAAQKQLNSCREELESTKVQALVLKSDLIEANCENRNISLHVDELKECLSETKEDLKGQNSELASLKTQLGRYTKGTVKKQLDKKEKALAEQSNFCDEQAATIKRLTLEKKSLQEKNKQLSLDFAEMRRRYERSQQQKKKLAERQKAADEPEHDPRYDHEDDVPVIRLKNEKGHFTDDAIKCVMALIGELEVPAHRCGEVIKAVITQICRASVPDSDLPSQRSALRFADRAHVIGKAHLAEALVHADQYDLHCDGTSRGGRKFVGHQFTVAEGSLSAGFCSVAAEDTTTLTDISIQILEELSELYPPQEAQENFVNMLQNLSGVMSDRAANMKSFATNLQTERQALLQTDEGIQFLHCNAHFLLGMGSEVKKALEIDCDEEDRLGNHRNKTVQYIWMTCDCLGPRGDDRFGCRDAWQAYCMMTNKESTVTSFRENRFNNLFQAAASLHYHRADIQDCLRNFMSKRNQKLENILQESENETLDCHLIALGLIYFWMTGPYWSLLGTSVHYLAFHTHVEKLRSVLERWQQDASPALDDDWFCIFDNVQFTYDASIFSSLRNIPVDKKEQVKTVVQNACTGLLSVTDRQLADFLPGGRYHNVEDPGLWETMKHSSLTNLVGEECLGDLDFSLFKRRHASLHHHSTVNMLKRNKSVSHWLSLKSSAYQKELLQLSSEKSLALRKKHKAHEKDAVVKKQEMMMAAQQKKLQAEAKQRDKTQHIMRALRTHQGPCENEEHITRLLASYGNNTSLKSALKAEIQYQKLVLQNRSPFLKVTGSLLTLLNNLRQFLGLQALHQLPPLQREAPQGRCAKRLRRDLCDDFDSDSDATCTSGTGSSDEGGEEPDAEPKIKKFLFQQQGELVAVFYHEDFYIGEVVSIHSPDLAEINFMEKTSIKVKGHVVYRWPLRADSCNVASDVVMTGQVHVAPSSSTGRAFVIEEPQNLPELYKVFRRHLDNDV